MGKRSPKKLAWSLLSLLLATAIISGCSSLSWWGDDLSNHGRAILRDLDHIHWSIDRHFFNYDWDDPYIGY
ncbi:MAG: hypothetical protein U1E76_01200 [Planctomycetota bacterium]